MSRVETRSTVVPQVSMRDRAPSSSAHVYNLTVLVQPMTEGGTIARAANLSLAEVRAGSVRTALSQMVAAAKLLISDHIARDVQIPWIDPPVQPTESESRFMVPLHL